MAEVSRGNKGENEGAQERDGHARKEFPSLLPRAPIRDPNLLRLFSPFPLPVQTVTTLSTWRWVNLRTNWSAEKMFYKQVVHDRPGDGSPE